MKKMTVVLLALAVLMLSGFTVAQTKYSVNTEKSNLEWLGEKVTGKHNGTIALKSGSLMVDGESITGSFVVDMTSLKNSDLPVDGDYNQAKLEGHLKSDDFFGVANHPTATFKITKVLPYKAREGQKANHKVSGELTIKGTTHPISFPAFIEFSDNGFTATGTATVDRSKYNVKYGSGSFFSGLGDKLIYDDFYLTLNIVGSKG